MKGAPWTHDASRCTHVYCLYHVVQRTRACSNTHQVTNSKAREEEFHLAFSRAKEQTEAREVYSTPQSLYARTHVYMDKIHYMCT